MAKKIGIVGIIIKYIFFSLILFITCLLLWRMCSQSSMPTAMKSLSWNAATAAAYKEHGEDMQVYVLGMPDRYRISPDGKFSVHEVYYIPEAKQLQLTLRYNDSTLRNLIKERNLPMSFKELDALERPFELRVLDDGGAVYACDYVGCAEKNIYNYERYIFDGVELEGAAELALEIIGLRGDAGGIAYVPDDEAYGAVAVYNSEIPSTPKKLTEDDFAGYEVLK